MQSTWILVADSARARLFSLTANAELTEVADFNNPEGRIADREMTTDRLPRVNESTGGARHAIEPHTSLRRKSTDRFARELGEELARGRSAHRYEKLVLVAAPRFLGALHGALDKPLRDCVVAEVRSNLTPLSIDKLRAHLPPTIFH